MTIVDAASEAKKSDNTRIAKVVRDHVDALRAASTETARRRIVDDVIRLLYPHFQNWAPQFCRVSGDISGTHREDIVNVAAMKALQIFTEVGEQPGKYREVTNWYSYLYGLCRYASLSYFHSGAATVASGMTTALRRQRHVARHREILRQTLGREPEADEIIEAANADMRARRSNPEKQGVLVDLTDLDVIVPAADFADHDREVTHEDDNALISPVEGRALVRRIIDACAEADEVYGAAAKAWLGQMYAEPPYMGTAADVATELGVTASKAERVFTAVRAIAVDLCRREFGISFPG